MITNSHLEIAKFPATGGDRFDLPGIHVSPRSIQATNGKGVIRHEVKGSSIFAPFVLCSQKALAIARQNNGSGPVTIDDNRIGYRTKEGLSQSFPIDSVRLSVDFPDCERLWPVEDASEEFQVDIETLISVLDHIKKTYKSSKSKKDNGVTFRFRSGSRVVEIVNKHSETVPKIQAILARK